jgi:hypothetical protein
MFRTLLLVAALAGGTHISSAAQKVVGETSIPSAAVQASVFCGTGLRTADDPSKGLLGIVGEKPIRMADSCTSGCKTVYDHCIYVGRDSSTCSGQYQTCMNAC